MLQDSKVRLCTMKNLFCSTSTPIKLRKQPKKHTEKEHTRLLRSSIRVEVVAKTIDEIYVLSTIAKSKKFELLKISKVMWSLLKLLRQLRNGRTEENKFFSWSLFHSLEFQKRKCQVFWSSFCSCIAILAVLWSHENIGLETLPILQRIFNYLPKTAVKSLKKKKFVQAY